MCNAARLFRIQTAGCRLFGHLRYGGQHGGMMEADFHVQPPQQVFGRLAMFVFHRVRQHAAHARHRFGLAADDKADTFALIGELNADLPAKLAAFVREVVRIKAVIKGA